MFCAKLILLSPLWLFLNFTSEASADALLPMPSLRHQASFNCWAYGGAQILEGRYAHLENKAIALDVEFDSYFWAVHDRLLNEYERQRTFKGVLNIGGYTAEYFEVLAHHGADLIPIAASIPYASFEFPSAVDFLIKTPTWFTEVSNKLKIILELQRELVTRPMPPEIAEEKILSAMNQVYHLAHPPLKNIIWSQDVIPRSAVFHRLTARDMPAGYSAHSFIMLNSSQLAAHPEQDQTWFHYGDDRYLARGMAQLSDQLKFARTALDRGWPVTFETATHIMTGIGYKTVRGIDGQVSYSYGIIDNDGEVFEPGFAWHTESELLKYLVDITLFYPAIADLLPPLP